MRRCVQCVLPESYPGIAFDAEGVCNYCRTHEKRVYRGEEELRKVVDRYRDSNKEYDCIVGLSGGRDSSYTLRYAVRELNLRVLAYTVDNGFIPEQTRSNIETMTRILNVKHVIERHDRASKCIKHFIASWMHRPSPAMLSSMCVGCRLGMILGFLGTARKYQIPLLLTGGGEPESAFAIRLLTPDSDRWGGSTQLVANYALEMLKNPTYFLRPGFSMTAIGEYICCFAGFRTVRRWIYPAHESVPLFEYIPWNEKKIMSVITDELNWGNYSYSKSTWRSDCKVALLKNYLYERTVGFSKNDALLSNMIRENAISRAEASGRLAAENLIPEEFVAEFMAELGLDYRDLDAALRRAQGSQRHVSHPE